mmetsp:Transcript_25768/g.54702  ORF Transcript_25768/g.54702 Transcript_25768/m.54702 type:complete len:654 (-) Transcript_25768:282-2243(-)|eukprot:CAMPEP_0206426280 /NCGR_PEP_ID=MMETSP0324_2-20121206/4281_1 /ASSEMBLY_ACC=CAM_ASM_000836 /TAXON_ID=2866 /ORGANISM="Crypthecodinium cohnii, Strain Seligo" /LENGTH=653 /DNA_ID=CAMNT_0053891199 /DNA_START=176 /DNA_END=2137 /DNA_ORIENTATION=+
MAAPGLQEGLLRDAEARRFRQQRRQEEAEAEVQRLSSPRLNPVSNHLWQVRCSKELRRSFENLGSEANRIPSEKLAFVLQDLGLLRGVSSPCDGEDHVFVERLAKFLDQERSGYIQFASLLDFLTRSSESGSGGQHKSQSQSQSQSSTTSGSMAPPFHAWLPHAAVRGSRLAQECNAFLERQLQRDLCRRTANRLSRPRGDPAPASLSLLLPQEEEEQLQAQLQSQLTRSAQAPSQKGRSQPRQSSLAGRRSPRPSSCSSARAPSEKGTRLSGDDTIAAIRCDLLYHQALAVDKENSEMVERIRNLRERESNFECTFHPNILPRRRPSPNPTPRPRNFDRTVARLRHAREEREAMVREQCHVPVGENYERLRRLGQQPFSCADREDRPWLRGPPLFLVEVEVGRGRTGRIGIYEGDSLERKARSFGRAFQLDQQAVLRLEDLLYEAYEARIAAGGVSQEHSLRSQSITPSVAAFELQESGTSPNRCESRSPSVRGGGTDSDIDARVEIDMAGGPLRAPRKAMNTNTTAPQGAGPLADSGPVGPRLAFPAPSHSSAAAAAAGTETGAGAGAAAGKPTAPPEMESEPPTTTATTTATTASTRASGPGAGGGGGGGGGGSVAAGSTTSGGSALELLARRYGRNSPVQVLSQKASPG